MDLLNVGLLNVGLSSTTILGFILWTNSKIMKSICMSVAMAVVSICNEMVDHLSVTRELVNTIPVNPLMVRTCTRDCSSQSRVPLFYIVLHTTSITVFFNQS